MKTEKPVKAKPHFYAHCLQGLQEIAKELGYNLIVHGSMNRDMDLIAVPWIDEPKSHLDLLNAFSNYLGLYDQWDDLKYYHQSTLAGGRASYIISLNRGGEFNGYVDEQYYLDISITPLLT